MKLLYNPHTLANEIRLKRTQHAGPFLLVEGPNDSRLYRRFIDAKQCHIAIGFSKETVVSAIALLEATKISGILGVVDADFDVLDGKSLPTSNVVRADCHDVEAMLIRSPALGVAVHELASSEKLEKFENGCGTSLQFRLLEAAKPLGYLRWHSHRHGLGLRFEGLNFSHFVDWRDLTINPKNLFDEVRNHSGVWTHTDEEFASAGWPQNCAHDPWHVCCGHDLVDILAIALRRTIGSQKNLTSEGVRSALRLAYSNADFANSDLATAIRGWETSTGFRALATSA